MQESNFWIKLLQRAVLNEALKSPLHSSHQKYSHVQTVISVIKSFHTDAKNELLIWREPNPPQLLFWRHFFGVIPSSLRRYLVAHPSENVGGGFGGEYQRPNERRRNLTQDSTNCSGDAFLVVAFGRAVDDVGRLFLDPRVKDLGRNMGGGGGGGGGGRLVRRKHFSNGSPYQEAQMFLMIIAKQNVQFLHLYIFIFNFIFLN